MKRKVTILGFIFLALILAAMPFMAACGEEEPAPTTPTTPVTPVTPATPTTPTTPATPVTPPVVEPVATGDSGDGMFTVLNPRGIEPPREFQAISPRLDTLSGKKVGVVNLLGGNDIVMTTIAPSIKALVPDCDAVYYEAEVEFHSRRTEADWAFIESCDAVIIGHDY